MMHPKNTFVTQILIDSYTTDSLMANSVFKDVSNNSGNTGGESGNSGSGNSGDGSGNGTGNSVNVGSGNLVTISIVFNFTLQKSMVFLNNLKMHNKA